MDDSKFRHSKDVTDRTHEHYKAKGRRDMGYFDDLPIPPMNSLSIDAGSTDLDRQLGFGKLRQKMQEDKGKDNKPDKSSGNTPTMSPGVMKFMMEFLKHNPDLAQEMSTRMNAVINGQKIGAQQGKGPPPMQGGQMPGMGPKPQQPPQMPPQGMPQGPVNGPS